MVASTSFAKRRLRLSQPMVPDQYGLSTMSVDIRLERMVDHAKLRWRIERDYLELKQEVGLGHYEGRGWRGLHHHGEERFRSRRTPRSVTANL
jgi:SRSO17 transposase